jgi:GAF domain-containing protein
MFKFFSPPTFPGDEEKTRAAELVNTILITLLTVTLLTLVVLPQSGAVQFSVYIAIVVYVVFLVSLFIPLRRGYVRSVGVTIILLFTSLITFAIFSGGTVQTSSIAFFTLTVIMAGTILGRRAIYWMAAVNTIIFTALLWLEINSRLPAPTVTLNYQTGIYFAINSALTAVLLGLALRRINEALERARLGEEKLSALNVELEERVNQRTSEVISAGELTSRRVAQLQTIADLSQAIAHVQNPNEIFSAAATLISERFGFYHVGIFLIDRDREYAVLQAANSAGGQKMLERGHRLMLGTGVVGFAAQVGKPRLALDVGEDAVFFNNPDLPETRSEIALPLVFGENTIGVLDVQSTEPGAFSEEDFRVLGTLANQLAIAIENARLLSEARAAAKQVQEVYNEFIRTQWSRTGERMDYAGFRYNAGRIEMLDTSPEKADAASGGEKDDLSANPVDPSGAKRGKVTVPVKLRGEVIGMLQVQSNDPAKTWRADELSLMEAVAERAALALENARLFQDARRRAAKERMIAEAAAHISSSMNIENILEATASELERVLGGSEVLIRFNSKDSV